MKKSILFLGVLLALVWSGFEARASHTLPESDLTIDIKPKNPVTPPVRPFSIVECDIEATYSAGVLSFVFNKDLGHADIVVTNIYDGEQWVDSVNGMGMVVMYTSDSAGYYTISIESDNGDYFGEFLLE